MTNIASPDATASPSPPSREPSLATSSLGSIITQGLGHHFGDVRALAPLDLEIEGGGVVGLLGPNGSGKSTLMRLLVGLVPCAQGRAWVDGVPLAGDGLAIRRRVTYAPGELHLYGELKGAAQLDFLLRGRGPAAVDRATSIALELGLPLHKRVRGYSHGMKRQLVFAAAMAPDVRVRILDEISEGLDPAKRSQILDRIEADAAQGTTTLLSSHHLGEVDRSCDRLIFINKGQLIADETATSVSERASRVLRLSYAAGTDIARVEAQLTGPDIESIRVDGSDLNLLLREDDPRDFLARLAAARELPAPAAVEHGRLSLNELYRSLYGVEGT